MNTYKVTAEISNKPACYYMVKAETPGAARLEVLGYLPEGTEAVLTVENTESDYLSKPIIEGLKFNIVPREQIKITAPSTIFCNMQTIEVYKQSELLELYKKVVRLAKEHGAKVSRKNGYKNTILELWDEYVSDCNEAARLLNEAEKQARIVEARGIHYGCSDDSELNALYKIEWKRQELFWRNRAISRIGEILSTLESIIHEFDMCDENRRVEQIYI